MDNTRLSGSEDDPPHTRTVTATGSTERIRTSNGGMSVNAKISCLPVSLYQEFFSGQRTIAQWSQQGQSLGLDAVDINALFLRDKSLEEIAAIRQQLAVPVLMVSAYSDFTLPDDTLRADALATALSDIRKAAAIGAEFIRLTAGQAYPGEEDAQMIRRVYDCFCVCAEAAAAQGVKILLENHSKPGAWQYPDYNFHMEHFLSLWEALKELPIYINFDTANAYALRDWERILRAVAGRIATIHLNDLGSLEPLTFAQVGTGIVPLEEILDAVFATGFRGHLCLEEAAFRGWEGVADAVKYTINLSKQYGYGQ